MFNNVEEYLKSLKNELKGSDLALIQDALSDAEEYLRTALEEGLKTTPELSRGDVLKSIIEKYGPPSEIASAYKEIESRTAPALAPSRKQEPQSLFARFFGVLGDPRAWGAFLYLLLAIIPGTIYGVWAMTGVFLSLFLCLS